jgi:hypothetical protein
MFIYFPEYIYKKYKELVKSTFKPKVNENLLSKELSTHLSSEENQKIIKEIKNKGLSLPKLEIKHCFTKQFLSKTSNYSLVENKIQICYNLSDDIIQSFNKEFSYYYDMNITYYGKDMDMNDMAKSSIKACKNSIHFSSNKLLNDELIRRCAYYELKYNFNKDDDYMTIKKHIDQNIY